MTSPDQGGSGAGSYKNAIGALDDHTLKYSPEEAVRRVRDQDEGSGAGSTVDQAARAYPVEVEDALKAWMAENDRQGIWVSPAGWWYAGWKHGSAALDAARSEIERLTFLHEQDHKLADIWRDQRDPLLSQVDQLTADLAQARARIEKLEKVAERVSVMVGMHPTTHKERHWWQYEPCKHALYVEIRAALDAAQATAEPTANDHETARAD